MSRSRLNDKSWVAFMVGVLALVVGLVGIFIPTLGMQPTMKGLALVVGIASILVFAGVQAIQHDAK